MPHNRAPTASRPGRPARTRHFGVRFPFPFLLLLPSALLVPRASAYRYFLSYAPNSDKVPCAGLAGCSGVSLCEAWGHKSCSLASSGEGKDHDDDRATAPVSRNASLSSSSTPLLGDGGYTDAGEDLKDVAEKGAWTVDYCSKDSDGDGKTNGDELGDGCCAWSSAFPTPMTSSDISNPAEPTSVTPRTSCSKAGAPPTPTGVAVASCGWNGCAAISWNVPAATAACVCEWEVTVVVNGGATSILGTRDMPFRFCSLPSGASVTATVRAKNRAGTSSASSPGAGTAGTSSETGTPSCSTIYTDLPFYINAAQKSPLEKVRPWKFGGVAYFALIGLAIVLLGGCLAHSNDPWSFLRRAAMHKYMLLKVPSRSSLVMSPSTGYIFSFAAFLGAVIGCAAYTTAYYDFLVFPLNTKAAIARGIGFALAGSMGFQLIPVSRYSFFLPILGVPFERALRVHRWAGWVTIALAIVHAVLFFIQYSDSEYGIQQIFQWLTGDAINPLAGFLSGVCMVVLGLFAFERVRRWWYELFLLSHLLWIPAFVLAFLHIKESDTTVLPFFIPAVVIFAVDVLHLFADLFLFTYPIVVDAGVVYKDGNVVTCSGVEAAAAGGTNILPLALPQDAHEEPVACVLVIDSSSSFTYAVGQYVYLSFPSISFFPHPVSISSLPDPAFPGRFSVHIRNMGSGSWSGKLTEAARKAVQLHATRRGVAGVPGGAGGAATAIPGRVGVMPVASPLPPHQHQQQQPQAIRPAVNTVPWALPFGGATLPRSTVQMSAAHIAGLAVDQTLRDSLLSPRVSGPFGVSSVQLEHYNHFVLFAGGIGITPIASLHCALACGQPVNKHPSAVWTLLDSVFGVCLRKASSSALVANVRTLTTVWSVREAGLLHSFAPLLVGGSAPPSSALPSAPPQAGGANSRSASIDSTDATRAGRVVMIAKASEDPTTAPSIITGQELDVETSGLRRAGGADTDQAALLTSAVQLHIHHNSPAVNSAGGSAGATAGHLPPRIGFRPLPGRPDIRGILRAAAASAAAAEKAESPDGRIPSSPIPVAVVVCGPQSMVEEVLLAASSLSGVPLTDKQPQGPTANVAGARVRFDVHRETFLM